MDEQADERTEPEMPQAGWYDDPEDATGLRYWDGTAWTDQRRPREVPPPPPGPTTPPPPAPGPGYAGGYAGGVGAGSGGAVLTSWPAPPRTFPEAIEVCLRKYVDFTGRASRSEYWYFTLFTVLLDLVASALSDSLSTAATLAVLLPSIAVGARRLHDIGRSGWNQLWFLLPFIGWVILLVRLTRPGDPGPNAFG